MRELLDAADRGDIVGIWAACFRKMSWLVNAMGILLCLVGTIDLFIDPGWRGVRAICSGIGDLVIVAFAHRVR